MRRHLATRAVAALVAAAIYFGNIGFLVWIWVHDHNLSMHTTADVLARSAGLAGLIGAYLALVQVVLLSRLPLLERVAGFDRLTQWHRWNGHLCIDLIVVHVVLQIQGYSMPTNRSFLGEFWEMVGRGEFPGMVTATIGTVFLLAVAWSSFSIARRHLNYELWYAVHLTAYAGIALAWFHEIPTGGDLNPSSLETLGPTGFGNPVNWHADYWRGLAIATLALLAWRLLAPFSSSLRHQLRVAEVIAEGPGVTSLRISGRKLDRLKAEPGQFFIWRFLSPGQWWAAHPFSLSAAPNGDSFRITAKSVGGHTSKLGAIPVGTRVVVEGPFGDFTERSRRRDKVLLVAGGIGITPVRALLEHMNGDVVTIYRVISADDIVFAGELADLERRRGFKLHYVVGDHAAPNGHGLLSPEHLNELVPDLPEREVYLCGPPAMTSVTQRRLRRAGVPRRRMHVERFAL
ncbi:MAG TPA: ferredoxin reductase family protein [Gaiellaceae bacterium]|jgi:predicted ferric reductase